MQERSGNPVSPTILTPAPGVVYASFSRGRDLRCYALGLSTQVVEMSATGRPFTLANKEKPVAAFFYYTTVLAKPDTF